MFFKVSDAPKGLICLGCVEILQEMPIYTLFFEWIASQSSVHLAPTRDSDFLTTEAKVIVSGLNLNWNLAQTLRAWYLTTKLVLMSRDLNS